MTDLLPCPFCGSPARTDLLPHAGGPGWVQCSSCEIDQYMSDTLEEAVARWNTRAPAATPTPVPLPLAVRLRDEEGPPLPQMVAQRRAVLSTPQSFDNSDVASRLAHQISRGTLFLRLPDPPRPSTELKEAEKQMVVTALRALSVSRPDGDEAEAVADFIRSYRIAKARGKELTRPDHGEG